MAAASVLDASEVAGHVAKTAAAALSCERAALYLWDAERDTLDLAAFHDTDAPDAFGPEIQAAGVGTARMMLHTSRPFVVQDTQEVPQMAGPWGAAHDAVSVYGMPLQVGTKGGTDHVGILVVAHTTTNPRGFTALCKQVAAALAGQAAIAIDNARLCDAQLAATHALKQVARQRAEWISGLHRVVDDGPGIPSDLAVFERFARGAHGGSGLGLFTVKKIVELHDGTIEVDRQREHRTALHVRLPLHTDADSAQSPSTEPAG